MLKAFSGGDRVTLQKKGENSFSYKSNAKLFFTANGLPTVDLRAFDTGVLRRFQIIMCNSHFEPNDTIFDTLTTNEMKNLWINWLIIGYNRLKNNKWILTNNQDINTIQDIFEQNQSLTKHTVVWLSQFCEYDTEAYVPINEMFRRCRDWHIENNLMFPFVNVQQFGKFMVEEQKMFDIIVIRPVVNGTQTKAYKGIKLRGD